MPSTSDAASDVRDVRFKQPIDLVAIHIEATGQLLRIVGAATKTPLGLVPTGNTGGL